MRRTYRSKKESAGALDPKDVIHAMDEKSSAFDAFYIQNIKQTKRELSCMGVSNHYGAASNKVRKRKYVKRIVKDPEMSIGSSPSHSVFLTPDKSIRVNKPQDLFDQLLNSSSPKHIEVLKNNSGSNARPSERKLPIRQESKTYKRINRAKIKKYNCSSSIESDKENSNEHCESQNVTDLQSYELLVEKEKKSTPKNLDESINKIVNNISLLNNVTFDKDSSVGSAKKLFINPKHRLTANILSPSNSPSCSTPFKEKYRSKSIYKFSPIAFGKNEASPNYGTIVEDANESVVFVDKSPAICAEDNLPSPIIHLSGNKNKKSNNKNKSSITNLATKHNTSLDILQDIATGEENCSNKNVEVTSIEISDLQTTEIEPLIGFANPNSMENRVVVDNSIDQNDINKETDTMESNVENEILTNSKVDDIILTDPKDITEHESCSEDNDERTSSEFDKESSYDTCNSDQLSQCDDVEAARVPLVILERLNESVLQKYLDKMPLNDSEEDLDEDVSNELDSDDFASFEATQSSRDNSVTCTSMEEEKNMLTDSTNESVETSDQDIDSNNEEERCISFVTTRRRNKMTNDSLIFSFNNSLGSTSSTDCDKTVLSNKDKTIRRDLTPNLEDNFNDSANYTINEEIKMVPADDTSEIKELNRVENTIKPSSNISTRSSKLPRQSNVDISCRNSMIDEGKPGIVLQPGKKWERSLSIYRRMTMMTDSFDKSVLDDEDYHNKGRKYRQSVISTMEMQESGSLHNESIISRRSTFVSKPCRSTIRIIKEPNSSRLSLCTTAVSDDLRGFLNEDCDDTIIELSKLSIADSEHEVTVIENFHDTSNRVSSARDYVLRRCGQTNAILFDECYPETVLKNCRKIGEGVYGEVFLWRGGDGRARVMKIVPIAGNTKVNGEHQKDFQEIISEIVIAMELSAIRAPIEDIQREFDEGKSIDELDLHSVENATDVFNEVLAVRCVYGAYPSRLLDLWELYDECNGSENDNPAVLPVDQQYIVLELANAGRDLESYEFNSAEQAHALFLQVAFGLAVGEEAFQFEHRDLHWGNVLIAPTDQKFATFVLRGRAHRVARCGVAGTIIDYSLSRLALPLPAAGDAAALYNDLAADDSLFDARGDYQFQVYRLMREKLGNDWKNFEPYTNILWLHYTVDKMITALRYKRTNTKIHKHYIAKLKGIKNRILDYGSAGQFVLTDNEL